MGVQTKGGIDSSQQQVASIAIRVAFAIPVNFAAAVTTARAVTTAKADTTATVVANTALVVISLSTQRYFKLARALTPSRKDA